MKESDKNKKNPPRFFGSYDARCTIMAPKCIFPKTVNFNRHAGLQITYWPIRNAVVTNATHPLLFALLDLTRNNEKKEKKREKKRRWEKKAIGVIFSGGNIRLGLLDGGNI